VSLDSTAKGENKQCIYVLRMILTLNSFNCLVFVMQTEGVYYEVSTKFLYSKVKQSH